MSLRNPSEPLARRWSLLERILIPGTARASLETRSWEARSRLTRHLVGGHEGKGLGLDSLEERSLLAASPLNQLLADPVAPTEPDPGSIPVFIGPGDNVLIPDAPGQVDPLLGIEPVTDPADVPAFVGPGENEIVSPTTSAPTALDVVAGMAALELPRIPLALPSSDGGLVPGTLNGAIGPIGPLAEVGEPFAPERTRPGQGTAVPSVDTAEDPKPSASQLIDELLALDPPTRNERVREMIESFDELHLAPSSADEAVTEWLRAIEFDPPSPSVRDRFSPATTEPEEQELPSILLQIGALGLVASLWSIPPSPPRSRPTTRVGKARVPAEYLGDCLSSEHPSFPPVAIQVRDLSAHGLGIIHHEPLPGPLVKVIAGDGVWSLQARGVVRWTRRLGENVYASGIEIDQPKSL